MKLFFILISIISLSQCSSINIDNNPPFKITTAVYKNWTGGQPGVRGTNIKITYVTNEGIQFDSIYFRGRITKLETKKTNLNSMIIGYFNTSKLQSDIILSDNPIQELNNPIPETRKFPFQLKENEAVISFKKDKEISYHKIVLEKK